MVPSLEVPAQWLLEPTGKVEETCLQLGKAADNDENCEHWWKGGDPLNGKNGKDDEKLWKSRRSLILGAKKDCKKRGRHHPTLPTTLSTLKIFLQNAEGGRGYYPLGNTRVTHKTQVYNCHHHASPPYLLSF